MTAYAPMLADVYTLLDATDRRRLAELDHLESQVLTRLVSDGPVDGLPMFSELARLRAGIYREVADRPATRTTALDVPTPPVGTAVGARALSAPRYERG